MIVVPFLVTPKALHVARLGRRLHHLEGVIGKAKVVAAAHDDYPQCQSEYRVFVILAKGMKDNDRDSRFPSVLSLR